jgi:hypothetical protein
MMLGGIGTGILLIGLAAGLIIGDRRGSDIEPQDVRATLLGTT